MAQKEQMLHVQFYKKDNKLIYKRQTDSEFYKLFIENLQEGQIIDMFLDASVDTGSLAQLAKIHKCIKTLAIETGHDVKELKLEIKNSIGICVEKENNGKIVKICKSFADCSADELSLAIQEIIKLGDFCNINFR
jgi:hypothetical protein